MTDQNGLSEVASPAPRWRVRAWRGPGASALDRTYASRWEALDVYRRLAGDPAIASVEVFPVRDAN